MDTIVATSDFCSANPARLDPATVASMAGSLGCDPAALWAVCDVESSGGGFLPDARPKILFEAHIFGRLTQHRFDRTHPDISSPVWNQALYGRGGAHQYDRLGEALRLDRTAALEAASWGMFQVMGSNYRACGFTGVEAFVAAMATDEAAHFAAFLRFIDSQGLTPYLAQQDWVRFALGYNGAAEAEHNYDGRLADAYASRLG